MVDEKFGVKLYELKLSKTRHRKQVFLPEGQTVTCHRCNGRKVYEETGDLHRSGGIVPCNVCDAKGMVNYKWVTE